MDLRKLDGASRKSVGCITESVGSPTKMARCAEKSVGRPTRWMACPCKLVGRATNWVGCVAKWVESPTRRAVFFHDMPVRASAFFDRQRLHPPGPEAGVKYRAVPTNLSIDDQLLDEAFRLGGHRTKKATVNEALKEFVERRRQMEILELFGQIDYETDYDYKEQRQRG